MPISWKEVRAQAVTQGRLDEQRVALHREQALEEVRASRLGEIRRSLGLNQQDLAHQLGISQSRVSRIERGNLDQTEIATLRAFTEALGGQLEIMIKLGDERLILS